jgi:hypothetical protein
VLPEPIARIDLSKSDFSNTVVLERAIFASPADFSLATFGADADFSSATFCAYVGFFRAIFSADASFSSAAFSVNADFSAATFYGYAELWSVTFSGDASFWTATFSADVSFSYATFRAKASYWSATFSAHAVFNSTSFTGYADFSGTRFGSADRECGALDLTNAQFEKPASFRDAVFLWRFPVLAATIFHDKTTFTAKAANWPDTRPRWPHEAEFWRDTGQDAEEARESCAAIRQSLAKQGLPEEEHFFFRREMRFAGRAAPWHQKPLYGAFWALSDYGLSVWRPVVWLALVWLAGVIALWGVALDQCPGPMGHSGANVFAFFRFLQTYYPGCTESLPDWIKQVSGAQTVFSYILLFFLGLGLRARFRLR